MRFPPEFLDEIRSRVPVSEIVGKRVRLKKAGREWRGLSPFNAEKTPSFFVNDGKMAWFDFSSGRNGNIFDFVMATEGLTFPEAVERLAAIAGLPLPQRSPEAAEQDRRRATLGEALELAAQFFARCLADRHGAKAQAYLAGRGIGGDMVAEFRLGYAPADRFALRDHLAAKGASREVMIEAGLLVHGEGIAVPYDRFRDRVMFPICDRSGRVIAFGGRALDAKAPAKYLNSPETPLFHKGGVLFNHHRARKAAGECGTVIAVEGYVDVIAMTAAGFAHVVAPLGTALTLDQCDLLWRMAPEPILCFDGDDAGRRAAFKAVDTVLPAIGPTKTLRFAFLPEGQDPDDLARAGGSDAIRSVLEHSRPLVDVLWSRETDTVLLDTPEKRLAHERRLDELVRLIADEGLRRHYQAEIRTRLAALSNARRAAGRPAFVPQLRGGGRFGAERFDSPLARSFSARPLQQPPSASLIRTPPWNGAALPRREVEILALLCNHPQLLARRAEEIAHLDLGHAELGRLRDAAVSLCADPHPDHAAFKAALDQQGHGDLRRRIEAMAEKLPHWCIRPEAAENDAELMLRQLLALHRKARELHRELREVATALGHADSDSHLTRLADLQARISDVEGTEATIDGYGSLSGQKSPEV